MAAALSPNEEGQLLQTIEMFEVITQSQPMDYQSLEILKEAYSKLGRQKDVVTTSKRIAQAYVQLGQLSSAILEYETILQQYPDDPDVQAALAEIENKANSFAANPPIPETDFTDKPRGELTAKTPAGNGRATQEIEDGRKIMHKIFVEGKMMSDPDFKAFWPGLEADPEPGKVQEPFIQILAEKGVLPIEKSLKILCDKSRLSYMPLDKYDVDVELARTFPKAVCQRWCVLPFDRMSKTVLVATANPFNKQAAGELEAATQNRLLWYIAPPPELVKALRKVFR
ncbi:MAG: tetratricopeptide repeat protein [Limisphaerales bacterium]